MKGKIKLKFTDVNAFFNEHVEISVRVGVFKTLKKILIMRENYEPYGRYYNKVLKLVQDVYFLRDKASVMIYEYLQEKNKLTTEEKLLKKIKKAIKKINKSKITVNINKLG